MPRRLIAACALALALGTTHVGAHAGDDDAPLPESPVMVVTPLLADFSATYTVTRGRMRIGEMHTLLSVSPDGPWTYRSIGRTTGLASLLAGGGIEETSVFMVEGDRVVPVRHDYRMPGGRRNRDFSLDFDWTANEVSGEVRGEPLAEPLQDGAVDRHAMTIAVLLDLAAERRFPRLHLMVDRGRVRELETRIEGEERVETGAGAFDAVLVVQQRLDDPSRRYLVWVAETAGGLVPVRIQSVDDDGATLTLDLIALDR